jgi:hypothetical protein
MLAASAAIFVLGLFWLQGLTPDAPSANDDDVKPASAVMGADDAYPDFLKIGAKLQLTPEERDLLGKQESSKTPDLASAEPLIARNAEALALFAGFSRRARFTNPDYRDLSKVNAETPVPLFFPLIAAARMSSLRAESLLRQNRAPEALEEALMTIDAGEVLLRSEQPIISALVGLLLEEIGARRASIIIKGGGLDKARLTAAARRLSAHRGGAAALQSGIRFEYLNMANMLDHLPQQASKTPNWHWYHGVLARSLYLYQPLRTRALFAGRYRGMIEEAGKPCLQARPPSHEPVTVDAKPNTVGRILFNDPFPQYDKVYVKRCTQDFRVAEAAAAAALAAYRLDHKRWPASLAELVPGYLPALPADPFTGAPLLYSPETGETHSAGRDVEGQPL